MNSPFIKSLNSILVKPAGPDCNMRCGYCFYIDKGALFPQTAQHRMSIATLEEMIRQLMADGDSHLSIGWQGGEPTLMGLPFFEKAVFFQQKYGRGHNVGNGLMTNGLLLDRKWAAFLKKYHFLVGISIDGPEHSHDHYRITKGGQGTWRRVVQNAKMLLEQGVDTNAVTVVSDYSVKFPEEIYHFHKSLGLNFMQFIPCVETDPADPAKTAPFSVSPEAYGLFLIKLFDLWQADFSNDLATTSIRYFDSLFHTYIDRAAPECTLLPACGIYVVVEHNGDVYSCDFFVDPEWKLGNIAENNLLAMLNSKKQDIFGRKKSDLHPGCIGCKWRQRCHGGCTKDRLRDPADNNRSHFCEAYKLFFKHADQKFRQLAADWKERNAAQLHGSLLNPVAVAEKPEKVGRNESCSCGSGKKYKKCCGR
ncbi:MAG: anaerobic sulfatase maturase [Deltaproteobacteria bacterium]|nr:anaerobic sulfatase maturase [Deltaproteobacteria bacterium]